MIAVGGSVVQAGPGHTYVAADAADAAVGSGNERVPVLCCNLGDGDHHPWMDGSLHNRKNRYFIRIIHLVREERVGAYGEKQQQQKKTKKTT